MDEIVRQEYESLMELASARCRNRQEMDMVRKAFAFADEAHRGVLQHSGKPYILYPIEVARIVVSKVGLGYKSICASLLEGVVENTDRTPDDLRGLFEDKIVSLVEGLTNINNILESDSISLLPSDTPESIQAENLKRILLCMGDDVRVVLIKLADRLQCLRSLDEVPEARRDKVLADTMSIFIPLAHRLGLYSIKSELENIWLRNVHPDEYKDIEDRIDKDLASRTMELDAFIEPIASALMDKGLLFTVKKRIKTPYSIWYKMRTKRVPFDQIYDLYAVRIIFNPKLDTKKEERDEAFLIYTTVTSMFREKEGRLRDWIRYPKKNGYEALHMTVMSGDGFWVEVQVRSRRMDDIAEKGIAAHWAYKNDGYLSESDNDMDRWLAKVQEILNSDDIDALELLDIVQDNIVNSEIVVFTPKGEQRTVDKGATALDFAYKVHTDVGNHAIAAKVNSKLVALSRKLKPGDQVEIITAMNARPKAEWMGFLHTRTAKRRLTEWLRENAPDELSEALKAQNPEQVRLHIDLTGSPGLEEEIKNALKQIEGVQNVVISTL